MDFDTWLLFALTEAALCISPGPAVLFVTSTAVVRGFRTSAAAALGIVTGNVVYFVASALGIAALILASPDLFDLVRWAGVAYLVWLGARMCLGQGTFGSKDDGAAARHAWRRGVIVQLSNPKNLIFFVAIFPPFIDTGGNVPLQVLILGATSQCIEAAVLLAYGAVGARAGQSLRQSRFAMHVDRVAGTLLIGIAIALAIAGRGRA